MSQVSSEVSMSRMQRKMNKIAAKRQTNLLEAREQITSFLKANDFPEGDTNGKKGIFFVTFPLHEAVKQNNPYMTANLLLFGAIPAMKDTWGRTAYDYAKGKKTHQQIGLPGVRSLAIRSKSSVAPVSATAPSATSGFRGVLCQAGGGSLGPGAEL
eukprot:Skav231725  [mRNA]  locus=scaffold2515:214058:215259:- [translate_table: standard]